MANVRVRLDHAGMAALLTSPGVSAHVESVAAGVRAAASGFTTSNGTVIPVIGSPIPGRTQRAASTVTLAHPAGLAVEGKHGVLARACAENGLELHERGGA